MSMKETINDPEIKHDLANNVIALQMFCHGLAVEAGWWNDLETGQPIERNKGEMFMLMVTELAEGFEGVRKNLPDDHLEGFSNEEVELADCMIRILDYAGGNNLRVGQALAEKLAYNATREDHTIEHRKGEHGKKV